MTSAVWYRSAIAFALPLLLIQLPVAAQTPGSQRTTSAVGQLGLGDTAARAGVLRQLVCRGRQGIDLRGDRNATVRDARVVAMTLRYDRSSQPPGPDYSRLAPGACTWNPGGFPGVPAEPGVVYFDLAREAQPWSAAGDRQLDTTITAAAHFPDVHTVTRYLGEPAHYWLFYVDDVTNVSISFGAYVRERRPPAFTTVRGSYATATGTSVLSDGISGSVRDASPTRSTPTDRVTRERTPAADSAAVGTLVRAPLRLVSINTVLDRFTIQFSARPSASPTVRYSTQQPVQQAGTGQWAFPGAVLQGSGGVAGGFAAEVAGGSADRFRAQYTAWSRLAPERGKLYHFIITVPATPDQPAEQHVGQLTTVAQHARVVFTSYNLIASWTYTQLNLYAGEGARIELRPAKGVHRLTGTVTEIANAPDQLKVLAYGVSWASHPDHESDRNSASAVFNIGISPRERHLRIPFRIRSGSGSVHTLTMRPSPHPSVLMFELDGYIEVTRQ